MSRLSVNDLIHSVKLLISSRASWSYWSKDIMGGKEGGEDGVERSENVGEVWW